MQGHQSIFLAPAKSDERKTMEKTAKNMAKQIFNSENNNNKNVVKNKIYK